MPRRPYRADRAGAGPWRCGRLVGLTTDHGPLTGDQLRRYEDDGFLVLEHLVAADTVEELRSAYDQILDREVDAAGDRMLGGITRQVMLPSAAHPAFDRNEALATGTAIARQVFADDAVRTFDMLIFKPPGHPHETPWHQDMSYVGRPVAPPGERIPLRTIQFWVALDDVDVENGCMHFVPGLQKDPLLEHHVASGDPEDEGRLLALVNPGTQLDLGTAVAAPLAAGGATMHSYGTPHYTPPNRSATRGRRAYIFNLASRSELARRSHRDDG